MQRGKLGYSGSSYDSMRLESTVTALVLRLHATWDLRLNSYAIVEPKRDLLCMCSSTYPDWDTSNPDRQHYPQELSVIVVYKSRTIVNLLKILM